MSAAAPPLQTAASAPPRLPVPDLHDRRVLVTGLGGTLAPKLAQALTRQGATVLPWAHRSPGFDPARAFAEARPDAVAHLGTAGPEASAVLARLAAAAGLPFLFTSTAMVFDAEPDGPHAPQDPRTARDDYGRSKIACEDAIRAVHPGASIVRIGWQIDADAQGNNMLAALESWQRERGEVAASRRWVPACSFMDDTCDALTRLLAVPGVHHLDSNADDAWTFDRLVQALQQRFARAWQLRVTEDYRHDQRLVGGPAMPPLSARLAAPRG